MNNANNPNNYCVPEDVDDAFWAELEDSLPRLPAEHQEQIKEAGEQGKHIMAAGLWIIHKIEQMSDLNPMEKEVVIAGLGLVTRGVKDPWLGVTLFWEMLQKLEAAK